MQTKVIYRGPVGNSKRKYRQERFIISTFSACTKNIRRGIELCKDLGFDMVEFGWVNPEDSLKCMTACEEVAIDGIFQNWECFGGFQESEGKNNINLEKLSAYLDYTKKFRHVAGYYVWDEPLYDEKVEAAAEQVKIMEMLDPDRLPFTVAMPSYNPVKSWENKEFEKYLRKYTEDIEPAVLSLDYYPFHANKPEPTDQLDSSELFLDIALLRKLSLEKEIPMWFYFQTQDDPGAYEYRCFSPEKIRMQQYNALLHGAKGLQNYNVFNGAINQDSTYGPLYFFTKELNRRSHQLGKTFMALTSIGVFHSPELLKDNRDFDAYRQSVSESNILANEELPFRCSVGEFTDSEDNRYLFVQNRDYDSRREFLIRLKKKFRIYVVSQEDGQQSVLEEGAESLNLTLEPGDAILLRFQDEKEEAFLIDYVLKK